MGPMEKMIQDVMDKKLKEDFPQIQLPAVMKALPADNTPDPYADIPVFSTPTSDVLAKQGI